MTTVLNRHTDSINLANNYDGRIELHIGKNGRNNGRIIALTSAEARMLAYMLLSEVKQIEEKEIT